MLLPAMVLAIITSTQQPDALLRQTATVTGCITDTNGMPIRFGLVLVRPASRSESLVPIKVVQTDLAGNYVVEGLSPGSYIIEAVGPARPPSAFGVEEYRRTYYPGVQELDDARPLNLSAGETVRGVDVALPPVPGPTVEGRVMGGVMGELPTLTLVSSPAGIVRRGRINEDGAFRFLGLREGRYVLWASVNDAEGALIAWHTLDLKSDPQIVTLRLHRGGTLRGRIVSDQAIDGVRVGAALTDGGVDIDPLLMQQAEAAPDGTFAIDGLFGTRSIRVWGLRPPCRIPTPQLVSFSGAEPVDIEINVTCPEDR